VTVGDGSPGVPEEHPERVVAALLSARFFHGGAGAAVQEALLADAAGVAHMLRPRTQAEGDGVHLCEWDREREWNRGRVRARGVARVGDTGEGICAALRLMRKEDEAGTAGLRWRLPRGGARLGLGAGAAGFRNQFLVRLGWVARAGTRISRCSHRPWGAVGRGRCC
jgi:hypothetical protein